VTAISRLWRFSGTDPQTSCVLYNQLEPGSRFYAMRPLSEQDTVPLYARPTVVNQHQRQLNATPATSTHAESSRYIIFPLHHLTAMQCFCTRCHFAGHATRKVPQQTWRRTSAIGQQDLFHGGKRASAQTSDGYMITSCPGRFPPATSTLVLCR
jgi:hypothetical protein